MPLLEATIGLLGKVAAGPAIDAAKRREHVIRVLKKLNLDPATPPRDFESLYVYALVESCYGKPEWVLRFFRDVYVKGAFEESSSTHDWTAMKREIREVLARNAETGEFGHLNSQIQEEVVAFAHVFDRLVDRSRRPHEARLEAKVDRIVASIPSQPEAPARQRTKRPYSATLREIRARTRALEGRTYELAQIHAFGGGASHAFGRPVGPDGYLWLVGPPWAGKTALLAEAVSTMPTDVAVVAYFLSAREAEASREQFLAAVVPQLAWLLDRDPPQPADLPTFRDLWAQASEDAHRRERHVLLVVDGLDEDLRPEGRSVAALLPAVASGQRARVLLTSRPHYHVPEDVAPDDHPLFTAARVRLSKSHEGEQLRRLAEQEIDALLTVDGRGADLAYDVLGSFTAAAGPLSVEDVASITSHRARDVRGFVTRRAARTLQPLNDSERRYTFAHKTLLEYCQRNPDVGGDAQHRDRVHAWAAQWRGRGWPATMTGGPSTPRYLLDSYPASLAADRVHAASRQRLGELVTDVAWVDSAIACVGLDRALASLRVAARMIPDRPSVETVLKLVQLQAHHLRAPTHVRQVGDVATALAWEALRLGADDLAEAAVARLRQYPAPQLIPLWTTERTDPHLVSVLGRHSRRLDVLALAAGGRAVSGDLDGVVRLWDPTSCPDRGRELGRHDGAVWAVAVGADDQAVSGGRDGFVRIWNLSGPEEGGRILGRHSGPVSAVAVLAGGRVVSGGDDGSIRLWDPGVADDAGREIGRHGARVTAVAVRCDGRVVSRGDDGSVRLWDPAGLLEGGLELGNDGFTRSIALALAADGRVVSGGLDGVVRMWDPAAPEGGRELGRHDSGVWTVAVGLDGRVVSGALGDVRLWDPAEPRTGDRVLGYHRGHVRVVAAGCDGSFASNGDDGFVRLWDPAGAANRGREPALDAGLPSDVALAVGAEGCVATGAEDGAVRLWDPSVPEDMGRELGRHGDYARGVAVGPHGRVVSCGDDGVVRLWDPAAPDGGRELTRHGTWLRAVAVGADGRVASGDADGVVRLWDPSAPDEGGRVLGCHDGEVWTVAVGRAGCVVSGGEDTVVRMWDPAAPDDDERELGRHDGPVWAVAIGADGRVVSGGTDGVVRLWDPAAPDDVGCELGRHDGKIWAVAVSPDGHAVSNGGDGVARLWDPARPGAPCRELRHPDGAVSSMAMSCEGHLAVMAARGITVFQLTKVGVSR
jgi:WD40 repeat protein